MTNIDTSNYHVVHVQKDSRKKKLYHKVAYLFDLVNTRISNKINQTIFADIPEHYSWRQKLEILKRTSFSVGLFDFLVVLGSIILCANYISESYSSTHKDQNFYLNAENYITGLFVVDFFFGWITSMDSYSYFTCVTTWIDITTIVPVIITTWLSASGTNGVKVFKIFRFLRIFDLLRILKTFKKVCVMDEVSKQTFELLLTIVSLIFVAAGVIEILENDVKQLLYYDCKHSNEFTNWLPSCWDDKPGRRYFFSLFFSSFIFIPCILFHVCLIILTV